jgi:hypothetical protein
MRALKILVVVMGIMLVGGLAALVAVIAGRLSHNRAPRSFATAIDIPRGARIEAMATGADRLALDIILPEGGRQLLVIDLTTGSRLGTIELRTGP